MKDFKLAVHFKNGKRDTYEYNTISELQSHVTNFITLNERNPEFGLQDVTIDMTELKTPEEVRAFFSGIQYFKNITFNL